MKYVDEYRNSREAKGFAISDENFYRINTPYRRICYGRVYSISQ